MTNFTPVSAAIGGVLIGLSAVLLMLFTGRIAGISGIFGGLINPQTSDRAWRMAFIVGLIAAPGIAAIGGYPVPMPQVPGSYITIIIGGFLVGFGARLGSQAPLRMPKTSRKPKTFVGWIMLDTVNPQPNTKPQTKLARIGMAQPPKT